VCLDSLQTAALPVTSIDVGDLAGAVPAGRIALVAEQTAAARKQEGSAAAVGVE
jgi:hypothetical protein